MLDQDGVTCGLTKEEKRHRIGQKQDAAKRQVSGLNEKFSEDTNTAMITDDPVTPNVYKRTWLIYKTKKTLNALLREYKRELTRHAG